MPKADPVLGSEAAAAPQSRQGRADEANDSYAKALSVVSIRLAKPVAADATTVQSTNHP